MSNARPCALLGALLLVSCTDGTAVRITVDSAGAGARPDQLVLSVYDGSALVGSVIAPEPARELGDTEDLIVRLPDSVVGTVLVAVLDATRNGGLVGSGQTTFTPVEGQTIDAAIAVGEPAWCGDGLVREPVEQCDDGNGADDDGCSTMCRVLAPPDAGSADAGPGGEDAGDAQDAGNDGGPAEPEPAPDGGVDAGMDAGNDAGVDAGPAYPLDFLGHWPLDGDGSEETGQLDGVMSGLIRHVRGARGTALYFGGNSDNLNVGPVAQLTPGTALTLAAWFRDDESSSSRGLFEIDPPGQLDFQLGRSSGHMYFDLGISVDSFWRWNDYGNLAPQGHWQHVAVTFDGTQPEGMRSRLFYNGVSIPFDLIIPFEPTHGDLSAHDLYIAGSGTNAWLGVIDDMFLYQRALTDTEVADLYAAGAPPIPNDYAHLWDFEGSARDVTTGDVGVNLGNVSYATDGVTGTGLGLDDGPGEVSLGLFPELDQPSALSLSFWLYDDGSTSDVRYLYAVGVDEDNDFRAHIGGPGDDLLVFDVGNGADARVSVGPYSALVSPQTWTHVAVVFDGNALAAERLAVYIDGNPLPVEAVQGVVPTFLPDLSAVPLKLGCTPYLTNAVLDDVVLYNRVLDATEVAQLAIPPP